jgi:RES domain-containing protein
VTTVWRICRRPFADLSGDGARLYGGRWNTPGRPLIYAAETAALAVLEVRVHLDLDWDMLPDDYVLVAIDTAAIVAETIHEPPDDPRVIGDAWIESRRSALLRVPSWIVPESYNVLINPAHPDALSIQLGPVRPFQFDRRLWIPR